ncbi:MAG: hypothetical protein AAF802_17275 [Planctomycetota bacterium]
MSYQIVPVLICERGTRWRDAVRRFWGPFQHAPTTEAMPSRSEVLFQTHAISLKKMRSAVASFSTTSVVLWEDDEDAFSRIAETVFQIAAMNRDVVQSLGQSRALELATHRRALVFQELGVEMVLPSPETLSIFRSSLQTTVNSSR